MNAYRTTLTISANTTERAAASTLLKLERGTIGQIEIGFPPGCAALVHVAMRDRLRQFSPANEGEYWAWDRYNLVYNPSYKLDDAPFEIKIFGWNEDVRYSHKITFRVMVSPKVRVESTNLGDLLFRQVPRQVGKTVIAGLDALKGE